MEAPSPGSETPRRAVSRPSSARGPSLRADSTQSLTSAARWPGCPGRGRPKFCSTCPSNRRPSDSPGRWQSLSTRTDEPCCACVSSLDWMAGLPRRSRLRLHHQAAREAARECRKARRALGTHGGRPPQPRRDLSVSATTAPRAAGSSKRRAALGWTAEPTGRRGSRADPGDRFAAEQRGSDPWWSTRTLGPSVSSVV